MRIKKLEKSSVIAGLTRNLMMTVKHLLTNWRGLRVKPAMTTSAAPGAAQQSDVRAIYTNDSG
jgi:hypothetical protein